MKPAKDIEERIFELLEFIYVTGSVMSDDGLPPHAHWATIVKLNAALLGDLTGLPLAEEKETITNEAP